MRITLQNGPFSTYRVATEEKRNILIQSDTDVAGVAQAFGWMPCHCGATDGTIDCQHRTDVQMIAEAKRYLDEHLGAAVEDPGYF